MTLRDFLRRVKLDDLDKMLIWSDGVGWSNIDIDMDECTIKILPDKSNSPFSSDKQEVYIMNNYIVLESEKNKERFIMKPITDKLLMLYKVKRHAVS